MSHFNSFVSHRALLTHAPNMSAANCNNDMIQTLEYSVKAFLSDKGP